MLLCAYSINNRPNSVDGEQACQLYRSKVISSHFIQKLLSRHTQNTEPTDNLKLWFKLNLILIQNDNFNFRSRTAVKFVFSVDAVGDPVTAEKPRNAAEIPVVAGKLCLGARNVAVTPVA